jgi:hypothetical protein
MKQISGPVIPCIGIDVDPNHMTIIMIPVKWESLIEAASCSSPLGDSPSGIFNGLQDMSIGP